MKKNKALIAALILGIGVAGWGIYELMNPPVMMFGRPRPNPYHGHIVLGVGLVMLVLCRLLARGLAWFTSKIRHWWMLFIALVVHPLMHVFGLPHQEEWIVALLSGGITLSAFEQQLQLWWYKLRQRFKRKDA